MAFHFWDAPDDLSEANFDLILENNRMSRVAVEKGGAVATRKHRVYEMPIGEGTAVQ